MKKVKITKVLTIALAIVATLLIVVGVFVHPMGIIDGSVMQGAGEIIGMITIFSAWDLISEAIHKGIEASFKRGDTSIEITKNDEDKDE